MSGQLYATAALHRMVKYDARAEILGCIGNFDDIELFGNQVLIAPYVQSGIMWRENLGFPRTERLACERLYEMYDAGKGLLVGNLSIKSLYQGKTGLIVKLGDDVNKPVFDEATDDQVIPHGGLNVGDWVFTLQENTRGISLAGTGASQSRVLKTLGVDYPLGWPCKILYSTDIYGRVRDPDQVV